MTGIVDLLRMRLAIEPEAEEDPRPKRFAPYPVWSKVRALALLASGLYVAGVALPVLLGALWPLLFLLLAVLIAPPLPGTMENGFIAITPELIGRFLASRHCPACGQCIFDAAPASGYMPEVDRGRWWPSRVCANCGHDLHKRTAE